MLRMKRAHEQVRAARLALDKVSYNDEAHRVLQLPLPRGGTSKEAFQRADRNHEPLACCPLRRRRAQGLQLQRGGASWGDAVLRGVADVIRTNLREADHVTRYGGR